MNRKFWSSFLTTILAFSIVLASIPLVMAVDTYQLSWSVGAHGSITIDVDFETPVSTSGSDSGVLTGLSNVASIGFNCVPDSGYGATITLDGVPFIDYRESVGFGVDSQNHTVSVVFAEASISVSIDSPTSTWYSESPTLSISYTVENCNLDTILCDLSWYGIAPSGSHNDFEYTVPVDLSIGNGQWSLNVTAYSDASVTATDSVSFGVNIPNPTTYTITPSHDAHSTINPNTVQTVAEGGSQGFTYSADTGYNISSVKVDGVEVANSGNYTFSNVVADHTISVTSTPKIRYSDIDVSDTIANKSVTLSIYCTSGTNNLSQATWKTNSSGAWSDLSPVNFTSLTGWANSTITWNSTIGQTIGYQCNITDIAGNFNATAIQTFTSKAYYITASNDTYSLLEPLGAVAVCYGANQQFNFSALDGYSIENVIINGTVQASTTSPYVFLDVQGNQTISVSTSEQIWYVNATSDAGCTVDPSGLLMIPAGTWANFTFSPLIGYQLAKLYINGSEVSSGTHYEVIPTGNTTLYLTSIVISTGQPAGGGGLTTLPTPTPTIESTPTDNAVDIDEATKNNIILSVGIAALVILIASVVFAQSAKKTVKKVKIEAW
jgi:hypothetical protein